MKTKKIFISSAMIAVVIVVAISFASCSHENYKTMTHQEKYEYMLDRSRPAEAYQMPDFSGEITDVRITVKKRDMDYSQLTGKPEEKNVEVIQIYYGYLSDGKWQDIPAENYDLKDLSRNPTDGCAAMQDRHVVRIGDYIVLAFPVGKGLIYPTKPYAVITDTLNTEVIEITEYYSTSTETDKYDDYRLLIENMREYETEDYSYVIMHDVDIWYYLVIESDKLTEGYTVTVQEYPTLQTQKTSYTYDDIMDALNRE